MTPTVVCRNAGMAATTTADVSAMEREPAEIKVVVFYAKGIKSSHDRNVKMVIGIGKQRFMTDEMPPPHPEYVVRALLGARART